MNFPFLAPPDSVSFSSQGFDLHHGSFYDFF